MDARSLLRAKKAEARIEHAYASYSASGQLRCSVCAVPVKQWDAHLLTKQHRQSVAREKAQAQAAVKAHTAKRPAETSVEALGESSKRPRVNDAKAKGGPKGPKGLPEGFFSSGNRPAPVDDEEAEAVQGGVSAGPSTVSAPAAVSTTAVAGPPQPTGDDELDAFLFSIAQPEPEQTAPASTSTSEYSIVARGPRKGVPAYKELIPGQASYEAAPVKIVAGESAQEEETEPEETEAEKRERLAREEKEEIMGRLEEEERAQEDADSRVAMLKARMEALKKRREARAGAGAGAGVVKKGVTKAKAANGEAAGES